MNAKELVWVERAGRDADGEKFQCQHLVDCNDRVLATVWYPIGDEGTYSAAMEHWGHFRQYLSLVSAKEFCEYQAPREVAMERIHDERDDRELREKSA